MSEKRGGGYREIENQNIKESLNTYRKSKIVETVSAATDVNDPRTEAAIFNAESQAFSLEVGQYIDLIK